ncbi:hypothetical protein [Flexivirga sp.]|uniref:hypothetical protein n=1 Tax=Flexivirga sp. TaxID=1962927 RepID=UPI003F7DC414
MSSNMFRRTLVGAVAIAGAMGLAACNGDTASVTTPTGSAPVATSTAAAPTQASPSTSESAPSESTTSSSATSEESSPSETSSSSAAAGGAKDTTTKVTPDGTKLKFGQAAVIDDESDGKYKLTVKSIEAAPKSAYAAANLNETNGKMYYVKFDVTNLGGAKYGFRATAPNQFFLKPVFDSSEKGRAGGSPFQDLPGGCNKASYDEIAVGKSASACYYYQVTGAAPTKVMWDTYKIEIVWSK